MIPDHLMIAKNWLALMRFCIIGSGVAMALGMPYFFNILSPLSLFCGGVSYLAMTRG